MIPRKNDAVKEEDGTWTALITLEDNSGFTVEASKPGFLTRKEALKNGYLKSKMLMEKDDAKLALQQNGVSSVGGEPVEGS